MVINPRVPLSQRTKVKVFFGFDIDTSIQLIGAQGDPSTSWSFKAGFDPSEVWSQRNLYAFCKDVPAELKITQTWCWMDNFRSFMQSQNRRFPVPAVQFHEAAMTFANSSSSTTVGTRYLWLRGGRIVAMYYSYTLDMRHTERGAEALEMKYAWDDYVEAYNDGARPVAQGAVHVSKTWVETDSVRALFISAGQTMAILVGLALLGMLVFTQSCVLSVFVICGTMGVVFGLAFFILTVVGWSIGLIEVIALVYFIGYAVTYSLHIAHSYSHNEYSEEDVFASERVAPMRPAAKIRLQRAQHSLKSIGGAALGSSVTTAASSFFLLFCTLSIFRKLGSMCLVVTLLSIIVALGPLPACLMMCGPQRAGRCEALTG